MIALSRSTTADSRSPSRKCSRACPSATDARTELMLFCQVITPSPPTIQARIARRTNMPVLKDDATAALAALRLARRPAGAAVAGSVCGESVSCWSWSSKPGAAANRANITQSTVKSEILATPTIISKNLPSRIAAMPNNKSRYTGFPLFRLRTNWCTATPKAERKIASDATPPRIPCSMD